jgi:hypothetical protein
MAVERQPFWFRSTQALRTARPALRCGCPAGGSQKSSLLGILTGTTMQGTGARQQQTSEFPTLLIELRPTCAGRDRRARPETQKEPAHILRSTPYSFIIPSRGTAPQCCQLTPWRRAEGMAAQGGAGSLPRWRRRKKYRYGWGVSPCTFLLPELGDALGRAHRDDVDRNAFVNGPVSPCHVAVSWGQSACPSPALCWSCLP